MRGPTCLVRVVRPSVVVKQPSFLEDYLYVNVGKGLPFLPWGVNTEGVRGGVEMTSDRDQNEAVPILRQNTCDAPSRSVAERIADRILAAVAVGDLQPAERLPTERELAEMLGVSRTTVRQTLGRLNALRVLESRRGRNGGTFVGV